jgi:two-component system sensor histidine kinase TtrS
MKPSQPSDQFRNLLLCLAMLWPGTGGAVHEARELAGQHLNIGVLAFRGEQRTEKIWGPTVEYLSLAVPGVSFDLLPLDLEQMEQAVQAGKVSFIITNPGNYVELEYRYGVSRIATLQRYHHQSPSRRIHSAIIVRADRTDLNNIGDLKNRSVMAVGENAFGGFQVAWGEMKQHAIDPNSDLAELVFAGFPQDNIVKSVLDGSVDAGIIRGCLLEQMDRAGLIDMADLKVLGARPNDTGECRVSTPAYPDWPLAKLGGTSDHLAKLVTMTLLAMPDNHRAALAGEYSGWTIPVEYQAVHDLFRELQIGPYEWMRRPTLLLLWSRYWQWILVALLGVLWWIWHVYRVEQLVRTRTSQLTRANLRLQEEMEERQQTEQKLLTQQNELAHVARVSTAGELASGLAHELNQPLSAISSYAQGCIWRLESGRITQDELRDVIQRMASEAERAGAIIQRLRGFLRKEQTHCKAVDINQVVGEATDLFAAEANRRGIRVTLTLAEAIPPVCSETIQLQQVIINLLRNAADALNGLAAERLRIELSTHYAVAEGVVRIDVRDFGPGIDPQGKSHLFEPFFTTTADGMGLGLSLSQSIVESHGGSIRVIDNAHPGACFSIVLPVYKEP